MSRQFFVKIMSVLKETLYKCWVCWMFELYSH